MFQLRITPWKPSTRWLNDALVPALQWVGWLICVGLFVGALYSKIRLTGLVVTLVFSLIANLLDWLPRPSAKRLILGLIVAIGIVVVARHGGMSTSGPRFSRAAITLGLLAGVWHLRPVALRQSFGSIATQLAARPNSSLAVAVGFIGVALPVASIQLHTTEHVGIYDTLPVVATVVRQVEADTRDLTEYTQSPKYWRWAAYPRGESYYFASPVASRSGLYSCYPAGMEVFAWPVVRIAQSRGADLHDEWQQLWLERIASAGVAAGALAMFFLTALHCGSPVAAYLTTLMLATGSVFASTIGMLLWQQSGVVFWSMLVLLLEFRSGGWPSRWGTLVQGIACGMMFACRPSAVTFLVPFGVWVLARDWRRGLAVPLIAALAYTPWACLYWRIYGTIIGPSLKLAHNDWALGEYLLGVLFSPGRGLVIYQPWLLLLLAWCWKRTQHPTSFHTTTFVPFALAMVCGHLLLVASWPMWWGGHCYGSRLVAETVPLLGLLVVPVVSELLKHRLAWPLLASVTVVGILLHVPCQFLDAWKWNAIPNNVDVHTDRLWDCTSPPFLHPFLPSEK